MPLELECRVAISSTIACFQSEWDRASCTVFGTKIEDKVETKVEYREDKR